MAPVGTSVTCGEERHRLRWAEGCLTTLDHEDPEGERTLAALGGQSCPCIELLDLWHRYGTDLDVLVLGSRGSTDPVRPESEDQSPRRRYAAFRGPAEPTERIVRLLRLPGPLPDRLVATVIATWARRLAGKDLVVAAAMPRLHAALYGRALATLDQWLGAEHHVDVRLVDGSPGVQNDREPVCVELPFSWLSDVWARGFAIVAGRLCLTATLIDPATWSLATIDPDLTQATTVTLRGI
jgi:hypothetical protein